MKFWSKFYSISADFDGKNLAEGTDVILAAGQFAESFMEGAVKTDNAKGKIAQTRAFGSIEALCNNLHRFIRPDDIILVKASRSARFECVVDRLRDLFGKQQTME